MKYLLLICVVAMCLVGGCGKTLPCRTCGETFQPHDDASVCNKCWDAVVAASGEGDHSSFKNAMDNHLQNKNDEFNEALDRDFYDR